MHQQPFDIERADLTIRGMCYRPDGHHRVPTVVMLHGFAGHRMEAGGLFVQIGRALAQHDVAAIAFDFLHCGDSDGSSEQMLVTGQIADATRVTEWVQGQPFVDRSRLGLLGFSLGGLVAACLMPRTDAYRALALLAPTTVRNMCRFSGERETCPDGRPNVGAFELHPQFFTDLQSLDPLAGLARRPVPTLLVHGTGDDTVPPEESTQYGETIERHGGSVQRVMIEDADHGFAKPRWREPLLNATSEFFADTLTAPSPAAALHGRGS